MIVRLRARSGSLLTFFPRVLVEQRFRRGVVRRLFKQRRNFTDIEFLLCGFGFLLRLQLLLLLQLLGVLFLALGFFGFLLGFVLGFLLRLFFGLLLGFLGLALLL